MPSRAAAGLGLVAAGTALGLGGPVWLPLVAWGLVPAFFCLRTGRPLAMAAVVTAIGMAHGGLARRLDRSSCAATIPAGGGELVLQLREPVRAGRLATAKVADRPCHGSIDVRVAGALRFGAGAQLAVTGVWQPRSGPGRAAGVFRVATATQLAFEPALADRIRNRLEAAADDLYGSRAGMVEALVVGRRGGIDQSISDEFSRTGLVHLLSISGFHVGLIWGWLLLVLRAAGAGRLATPVAAAGVVGYVAFLGMPPPAVRAAALALLSAASRSRQRQPASGALLALVAAVVLLLDPWALTSLGAWFSVAALWGAVAATRWAEGALGSAPAWRLVAGSCGATIATAPLTAGFFGTVPLVGVILNVVAVPLAALAVPAVVGSLLLWGVAGPVAGALAAGGGTLLAVLEGVAHLGSRLPGAALTIAAGPTAALLAGGALVAVVWVFGHRQTAHEAGRRVLLLGAVLAVLHGWLPLPRTGRAGSGVALHFLNVGQGDATLLETRQGRWLLIDAGPASDRWNAGRSVIVPFLRRRGVSRLDGVVMSHAHLDHYGGLAAILGEVAVARVFDPAARTTDPGYLRLLDQIADRGIEWIPIHAGARIDIDGVTLSVVHPDPAWPGYGEDLNEDSAILLLSTGAFRAAFPGDAGLPAEAVAASRIGPVDVLKVGHHGSRTATGPGWLAALRPRLAVVSVGQNRYGHPSPEALARLSAHGVALRRTDRDGTVTVEVGPGTIRVRDRGGVAEFPID